MITYIKNAKMQTDHHLAHLSGSNKDFDLRSSFSSSFLFCLEKKKKEKKKKKNRIRTNDD